MKEYYRLILLFLGILIFKLWIINLFPLTADESYYWLWAKHLDLAYVDHPPLIAYLNAAITYLGGDNLFALRFGAITISVLISVLAWLVGRELFNDKVGLLAALFLQLIPHYLVVWLNMTLEVPLVLFWALSIYFVTKLVKTGQSFWWYFLGCSVGLGLLTKYTMFLFLPCLILFLLVSKKQRFWFRRKEPYLASAFAVLSFLPVFFWNLNHGFISFGFHLGRVGGELFGKNFLIYLVEQLVHLSPVLFLGLIPAAVFGWRIGIKENNDRFLLLLCFSMPVFLFFAVLSLKTKVYAHWPVCGYFAATLLTAAFLSNKNLRWTFLRLFAFDTLVVLILLFVFPGVLLHQDAYAKNRDLNKQIEKISPKYVFANSHTAAAQLAFYGKRPVYYSIDFLNEPSGWGYKQFELWGKPKLAVGDNILFLADDDPKIERKLKEYFEKIVRKPEIRLHVIEQGTEKLVTYYCLGYLREIAF